MINKKENEFCDDVCDECLKKDTCEDAGIGEAWATFLGKPTPAERKKSK